VLTQFSKLFPGKTGGPTDLTIPSKSESIESTKDAMKPIRLLLLFLSFCPLTAYAQTAEVGGAVQDPSGAVIPKASVEFRNQDTGIRRQVSTNGDGYYHIAGVDPGKYDATVQAKGFKTLTRENIVFEVGDKAQIDFTMQVGQASQNITVDGSGLEINTTDGSVGTVVDRQFVENIPLNGRSFQDLILLTPGVVTLNPQSGGDNTTGEFSVNGQRSDANIYTIDGVNANTGASTEGATENMSGAIASSTALGTTQSLVSVDALQEFRVSSSSYSAEYGLSPGGQFSFTTRSGTNQLHGAAFDYLRNNYFDANNWFNDNLGVPEPALRQNDFGGTLGGPIWLPKIYDGKSKSFFFVSYEGLRLLQPQATQTDYVPGASLRASAPAPIQAALNSFPSPTGADMSNGLAPFVKGISLPSNIDSTSVRLDQQITSKLKTFFRFSDTQSSSDSLAYDLNLFPITQSSYVYTFGATATLSPTIFNEFRLNYSSTTATSSHIPNAFGSENPVNLLQLQSITSPTGNVEIGLFFPGYSVVSDQDDLRAPLHAWNVNDGVAIGRGRHNLKLGIQYRRTDSEAAIATPEALVLFNNAAGVLANSSYFSIAEAFNTTYPSFTNLGLYVQDEWRPTQKLSLTLGLRWDLNPSPSTTQGYLPPTVQGNLGDPSSLTLAPAGTQFWHTSYYNLAPRLGFAYPIHNEPGRHTIVRGGGGVFFDSGQQGASQAFAQSPGQSVSKFYFGTSFPLTAAQIPSPPTGTPTAPYSAAATYFASRLQLPYTLQWNLAVEQALGSNQSFALTYVGSNGRRLLEQQELSGASIVGPNFPDGIYVVDDGTTSSYNALQARFQRSLARGLQVLASYSWSHSIDFGSQNLAYAPMRGNSDYDLRHNFNSAISYEISLTKPNALERLLVNHWGIDGRYVARSAFPVALEGNNITLPSGITGIYSSLDVVPGVPPYIHTSGIPGNRAINPAAFTLPLGNAYGDLPRNSLRGFGQGQVDLAARRAFPLKDLVNVQFRAEVFNLLNHPNFGYIQPLFGNPQFGQATETLNNSLGTLSPLYQQGGPRSMQFALRIIF
jgi:hypothetical protein